MTAPASARMIYQRFFRRLARRGPAMPSGCVVVPTVCRTPAVEHRCAAIHQQSDRHIQRAHHAAPATGERATIEGGIRVEGAWTYYMDFEVTNPNPDRTIVRPTGMNVYGNHVKLINLVIHDCGDGIGVCLRVRPCPLPRKIRRASQPISKVMTP